jgi:hypothetical protein
MEELEQLTVRDAVELLEDGHSVYGVELAQRICQVVGVTFEESLVFSWQSQQNALEQYGFFAREEGPGQGVNSLDLSYHVTRSLGLGAPGTRFTGRGYQARANAEAVRERLQAQGVM